MLLLPGALLLAVRIALVALEIVVPTLLYFTQALLTLGEPLTAQLFFLGDLLGRQRQPVNARSRLRLAEQLVEHLSRSLLLLRFQQLRSFVATVLTIVLLLSSRSSTRLHFTNVPLAH